MKITITIAFVHLCDGMLYTGNSKGKVIVVSKNFYSVIKERRSFYDISPTSKVPTERIVEVIKTAIQSSPSAFNSQSAKVILLFGEQHKKLWEFTKDALKEIVTPGNWQRTEEKITSFANGYGSVLYFDDASIVEGLQQNFPSYCHSFPIWAQQSNGILQYMIWASLQAEGLGASLQHYNPLIDDAVKKAWDVPESWELIAQMPFGVPETNPEEKTKHPIEERFLVYN